MSTAEVRIDWESLSDDAKREIGRFVVNEPSSEVPYTNQVIATLAAIASRSDGVNVEVINVKNPCFRTIISLADIKCAMLELGLKCTNITG